ncbi:transporter [Flavobacterium sp. WC2429]|uniref:Transporter n=2 Tax=unclassified Flavobacterium TaxID=196869 RepID=A0AB39WGH1_9FLAO
MKKTILCCFLLTAFLTNAQTDTDAIMMGKQNFCVGSIYQYSSWKQYWEGSIKRDNLNMGTVSTKSISMMGNYGISDNLNVLFSLPYVQTNASAGTMSGQNGIQDLSLTLKYMTIEKNIGNGIFSLYVIGGFSTPVSNYTPDYLPLSIGLHTKTGQIRLMGDYQIGKLFTTISGTYIKRGNASLDRNTYLTDEIHYTNKVDMPDAIAVNFRFGYRSSRLIAEAVLDNWVTQSGGFDITKNNMPFISNTMNTLKYGFNSKYTFKNLPELSIVSGCNFVISGRNVGQSNTVYGGLFYILNLKKTQKEDEK